MLQVCNLVVQFSGSAADVASPKSAKVAHHAESPNPAESERPEIAEDSIDSAVLDYDDHGIYMAIDGEGQVESNSVSTARLDDDSHTIDLRASRRTSTKPKAEEEASQDRRTSTKPKAEEEASQDMGENGDAISGGTEPSVL
jgi:hypothetical protein